MNFRRYVADLKSKIKAIESSSLFKSQSEFPDPIVSGNINEMEAEIASEEGMSGFALPKPIKEFYRVSNGFQFAWQYKGHPDKSRVTTGLATISELYEIYDPDEELGRPHAWLYEKYRLFDWAGEGDQVYMKFSKGSNDPALFYFTERTKSYHPMSLDFTAYLGLLAQVRGLYPWRKFFVADKRVRIDAKRAERFIEDLRLLFPDADPTPFSLSRRR